MKQKLIEWLKRYVPAEICALAGVLIVTSLAYLITKNRILSAYIGAQGENLFYYGFLSIREVLTDKKKTAEKYKLKHFFKTLRNLVVEFGPAEALDSLLVRPASLYFFPLLLGNYTLGLIVGKYVADIVFYVPTIISYELRKKFFKN